MGLNKNKQPFTNFHPKLNDMLICLYFFAFGSNSLLLFQNDTKVLLKMLKVFCCTNFFDLCLCSSRFEKDVLQVLSKLYQTYLVRIFEMSGWWFLWHPKGRCTPPHKSWGVFSDILATASRLNTLYGRETWYVQSSRNVKIITNVLRYILLFYLRVAIIPTNFCETW